MYVYLEYRRKYWKKSTTSIYNNFVIPRVLKEKNIYIFYKYMYNILYTCINLKVITILYFEIKEV